MDIDYKKYHRDREYLDNEILFKNIFLKRYFLIKKFVGKKGRVLDIGCTNGIFLDLFKNDGWETWGVEPSDNSQFAQQKGHRIINNYFELANLANSYFDLVIMNHTLEHVKDANIVVNKIYKILKKNGLLFIDVPNAGGLGSKLLGKYWPYRLPNEHVYQFTRKSLSILIKKNNFKLIGWESRSGLLEFANPWQELWLSLTGLKKRFFYNILTIPYSLVSTFLQMGDSMSFVARKK